MGQKRTVLTVCITAVYNDCY